LNKFIKNKKFIKKKKYEFLDIPDIHNIEESKAHIISYKLILENYEIDKT